MVTDKAIDCVSDVYKKPYKEPLYSTMVFFSNSSLRCEYVLCHREVLFRTQKVLRIKRELLMISLWFTIYDILLLLFVYIYIYSLGYKTKKPQLWATIFVCCWITWITRDSFIVCTVNIRIALGNFAITLSNI